jgi:hypothetical protein
LSASDVVDIGTGRKITFKPCRRKGLGGISEQIWRRLRLFSLRVPSAYYLQLLSLLAILSLAFLTLLSASPFVTAMPAFSSRADASSSFQ